MSASPDDLAHLFWIVHEELDFYDESRFPALLEAMVRIATLMKTSGNPAPELAALVERRARLAAAEERGR